MRLLYIYMLGYSNSGKSTFINKVINAKVSSVTCKINTTYQNKTVVYNRKNYQLVFTDTPGITRNDDFFFEKKKIFNTLISMKKKSILCIILDITKSVSTNILININYYTHLFYKPLVIFNKIDLVMNKNKLICFANFLKKKGFNNIFMISSLKFIGIKYLLKFLTKKTISGYPSYHSSIITDQSIQKISQEITREKLLIFFSKEIPYLVNIYTSFWHDRETDIIIHQTIMVKKKHYKNILLNNKSETIKLVSQKSRYQISLILKKKVHLYLYIKNI